MLEFQTNLAIVLGSHIVPFGYWTVWNNGSFSAMIYDDLFIWIGGISVAVTHVCDDFEYACLLLWCLFYYHYYYYYMLFFLFVLLIFLFFFQSHICRTWFSASCIWESTRQVHPWSRSVYRSSRTPWPTFLFASPGFHLKQQLFQWAMVNTHG